MCYRFLYSVVWKNVGALDDDLFGRFFFLLNTSLGIFYAMTEALSQVRSLLQL